MPAKMRFSLISLLALFLSGVNCVPGLSQERYLSGSVVAGWSYTRQKSTGFDQARNNPFSLVSLNHKSYIFDPRFISYQFEPRLSSGFEDFRQGQPEGSGFRFASDFLRDSPWPVSFSYQRIRRLSPTLASGVDDPRSVASSLGLGIRYSVPGRPHLSFQYTRTSGFSDPGNALPRSSEIDGRSLNFRGLYSMKGWSVSGFVSDQENHNRVLFPVADGFFPEAESRSRYIDFDARRDFGADTRFNLTATRTSRDTMFRLRESAYGISRIRGQLTSGNGKKFRASVLGRYSTHSMSTMLESNPGNNQGNQFRGASTEGGDWGATSNLSYKIKPYLTYSATLQFTRTKKSAGQESYQQGSSFSGNTGIQLRKGGRYWMLSSGYHFNFTRIRSASAATTQSFGQSMNAGFSAGDISTLRATTSYQWSRYQRDQGPFFGSMENAQQIHLDISRKAFGILFQARGGLWKRRSDAWNRLYDTISRDFTINLSIPRVRLSYSRRTGSGDFWQFLWPNPMVAGAADIQTPDAQDSVRLSLPELAASGVPLRAHGQRIPESSAAFFRISEESTSQAEAESSLGATPELLPLFTGSGSSGNTFTAAFNIARGIRVHGTWQRHWQAADFRPVYRYERQDITFEWRFRQMAIEASYYMDRYGTGAQALRKHAVIRVARYFRIF